MSKENCKGFTKGKNWPYSRTPCFNKAGESGYCKIHDPKLKAQRHKERMDEKDRLYKEAKKKNP